MPKHLAPWSPARCRMCGQKSSPQRASFSRRLTRHMADTLQARIAHALSHLKNPGGGGDLVASQKVRDIATTTTGKVRVTLMFEAGDDPQLARTIRQTLEKDTGVTEATVNVGDAK